MRFRHLIVLSLIAIGGVAPTSHAAPAPPTAASRPSAKPVSTPAITTVRRSGTWDLNGPIPYEYDEPVLTGASDAARTAFSRFAQRTIAREKAALAAWHSGACAAYDGNFSNTVESGVYKNRYASVVLRFSSTGCGGVPHQRPRGFTLDLKTLKSVGPGHFTTNALHVRDWAIVAAMLQKYQHGCTVKPLLDADYDPPRWSAWRVSARGFTPYYERYALAEGACGDMYATIPWRQIARQSDRKGQRKTGYYRYYGTWCENAGGSPCGFLKVVARGSIVRYYGGVTGDFGWVGVRTKKRGNFATTGSGAGKFERLRFASDNTTLKPKRLGPSWRRVSKKTYEGR